VSNIRHSKVPSRNSIEIAIIASFVFPGLGQLYNGQVNKAIKFVILGVVFGILTQFLVGFIFYPLLWIYGIYDAYGVAKEIKARSNDVE